MHESLVGTKETLWLRCSRSAFEGEAESICWRRVFPALTHFGSCLNGLNVKPCRERNGNRCSGGGKMKIRIWGVCAAAVVLCLVTNSAKAADPTIVGTWRVTSFTSETLETKEITRPFGNSPIGYIQYSPGGHMVVFFSSSDQKRPENARYTDVESAEAHRSIIAAYAGTYRVDGDKVVHHVVASWLPHWVETDQVRFYTVNGTSLAIKSAPFLSPKTGKQVVSTQLFERIE